MVDANIVIVGAGLAGAATAYHLAMRHRRRVTMIEKEAVPGVHSSGRNAAMVRAHGVDPLLTPLVHEGAEFLRRGRLARFERRGVMLLGMGNEDIRSHFPRACGTGLWCPHDGTVDVAGLLQAYLEGVEVHFDTEVLGWSRIADRLCVQTNRGELACDLLVNATGPWAGHFGRLPIRPYNRHLFATAPMAEVDPGWPCVWDTQGGLYFRPESGGLLLSVCDETPAEPGAYHEDPAILERLAEKVRSTQPDLGEFGIRSNWVGQRAFAPDRRFVIGFDPRDDRVFHVAALGGHGVTASYSVGRIAADMIAGQRVEGVGAFSPSRLKEPIGGQDFLLY